jgi:hypothetical protein
VGYNSSRTRALGTTDDAQVYHGEVAGIEHALRMLLEGTLNEATHPAHPRTAVIYSDNQAALRTLAKGDPLKNQALIRNMGMRSQTEGRSRQHPIPLGYLWASAPKWKRRWAQGSKGEHVRQLNAEPSRTYGQARSASTRSSTREESPQSTAHSAHAG